MVMPLKRRYTKYSFEDTQRALEQQQRQLKVEIVPNTSSRNGRCVGLRSAELDQMIGTQEIHVAVILARSSDWYRYSLNTYRHDIECVVAGTHDSCLEVPALSMDDQEWHDVDTLRLDFEQILAPAERGIIHPRAAMDRENNPDLFEARYRKTRYGHRVLVGGIIRGRADASQRLMTLPERTRFRIEAEARHLRKRRPGRPLLF